MEKDVIVFILEVGLLLQVSVSGCRSGAVVVVCGGGGGDYGWLVDGARLGVVGTRAGLVHVFGEDLVEKAAVDLVLLDADVVLKTEKISSLLQIITDYYRHVFPNRLNKPTMRVSFELTKPISGHKQTQIKIPGYIGWVNEIVH